MRKLLIITLSLVMMMPMAYAKEIGGASLPDSLKAGEDQLLLNGAGLRKKLFIKVYAGGLYLKQKMTDPQGIIDADDPMAIRMHFIYDGVSSKKLTDGWNEGFNNATNGNTAPIKTEIDQFNGFFSEKAKKNDIYDIIYIPDQGASVYMKGKLKGTVKGLTFKKTLFSIWLGEKPADAKLKKGMLGK